MAKENRTHILLLPGDAPPRRSTLRRLLLYFDAVTLPDVTDRALINLGEMVEEFPGRMIRRIERGELAVFPRTPDYDQSLSELIEETIHIQNRGLLRFVPRQTPADPVAWLVSYHAAIADEKIVRAAIPDFDPAAKPSTPNTILWGGAIAPKGMKSRYDVPFREPVDLPETPLWSSLAWLRIGRTVKYLERARRLNLAPFAADAPSAQVCIALSAFGTSGLADSEFADLAIAFDLVGQRELESVLLPLTWNEVLELRRRILPHLSKVRQQLLVALSGLQSPDSLAQYRKQVRNLRDKLQAAQDDANRKWRELGLAAILKTGGAAGGLAGLEMFVLPSTWGEILLRTITTALVAGATLSSDIKQLYSARRSLREHPLFHVDEIIRAEKSAG